MDTVEKPAGAARERLGRLRDMLATDRLTGFIVPHADEHQSEYLPAAAERLAWLTGFIGSAGMAIVLKNEAAIFVDGRYTLQARAEVDGSLFTQQHLVEMPPAKWLGEHVKKGDRIGYDPWLMTVGGVRRFADACKSAEAELVPISDNPIDRLWSDRPPPPLGAVSLHPVAFAGEEASDKIARVKAILGEKKADGTVLTQPDSIAWLFNIRGEDTAHNPAPLAFAILPASGKPSVFIDGRKLSNTVRSSLADLAEIHAPAALAESLKSLGEGKARVLLDPQSAADAVAGLIREAGGTIVEGADPVILPKARKNPVELAGARAAQIRDGAAMVRFLAWLDQAGISGDIDEVESARKLAEFRADTARRDGSELADLSFETISGAGPNGAIVHYRVKPETARRLAPGMLYLVDSGAQYRDGTTDITRTVALGQPTAEMRERFTRVLKGHTAIATARFPVGTSGAQIDALARVALWQAGLDYDHGTGHGIGSFLSVHEGPARISKLGAAPLEPGMILSDEPGYYKPGEYGIRIENLVVVTPASDIPGGDRPMLGFETLTLAPIDRRLIEPALLSPAEVAWINTYHAGLAPKLDRLLGETEREWLKAATASVG
jgi:Xaa-Pro aminopeptidase